MKVAILHPSYNEYSSLKLQAELLAEGLRCCGDEVKIISLGASQQSREDYYAREKPDAVIGVGYWGNTPEMILEPKKHRLVSVPWFNADGWVANHHDVLNKLPLLVVTSNWVKSTYMRDGLDGRNIQVCPVGYDPAVFFEESRVNPEVMAIRNRFGIKDDEVMILTIGGDVTSKGAQEMLEALGGLKGKYNNWKYVCKTLGNPSALDHYRGEKEIIDKYGLNENVIYDNTETDHNLIPNFLNACDIYAAPSRLEGFGMVQVEAQACGKPVISINVGGPRDTIVHNKTGFLVDVAHEVKLEREWVYEHMGFGEKMMIEFPKPKTFAYRANIDQLAEATLTLCRNEKLRNEMGKAAAIHAREKFDYRISAKIMRDLIKMPVII